MKAKWAMRVGVPLAAALLAVSSTAQAQFSEGYRFLEAVKKKDGAKVEEMLGDSRVSINTKDLTTGDTALHLVTQRRDDTWLRFLVAKGADVNSRNARGVTPLVIASNLGWIEGVERLVASKARLDEANDAGETPLISAVHRRHTGLLRILLKAGADPDRADNSGRTARDYAKLDGNNSPLLQEIEANARLKGQRGRAQRAYGPSL